jgi:hypothetical protein
VLIANNFAFIHMPKTGGTWIADILRKHAPEEWNVHDEGKPHMSAGDAPPGKKLIAFARNPWDWYVSVYFYFRHHWIQKTGGYILPKSEWKDIEKQYAQMFERAIVKKVDGFQMNMPAAIRGELTGHSQLTRAWEKTVGTATNEIRIGKFENIRADLVELLKWANGDCPSKLKNIIASSPRQNTSNHKPYHHYYSGTLVRLVSEMDCDYIKRFGYVF